MALAKWLAGGGLLIGALAACGGGDAREGSSSAAGSSNSSAGSGSSAGSTSMGENEFLDQLARAECAARAACCPQSSPLDVASCSTELKGNYLSYVFSGRVFDPAGAAKCLAAATTPPSCANAEYFPSSCWGAYLGKVQPGQSCMSDLDCASSGDTVAACESSGNDEPRLCVQHVRGKAGDECSITCSGGTGCSLGGGKGLPYCDTADGLYCGGLDGCVPFEPLGSDCFRHQECGPNAYCDDVCKAVIPQGQACPDDKGCAPGNPCLAGVCTPPQPLGKPCDDNGNCISGSCLHLAGGGTSCIAGSLEMFCEKHSQPKP